MPSSRSTEAAFTTRDEAYLDLYVLVPDEMPEEMRARIHALIATDVGVRTFVNELRAFYGDLLKEEERSNGSRSLLEGIKCD